MTCPRCNSEVATKDVTTQLGGQRFRCSRCGRRFTRRSNSAFSGRAFPDDIIALAVRWYVRYRLSYIEVSEWLAERGILVDQSTIYRWVQRFLPLFGEVARERSWRGWAGPTARPSGTLSASPLTPPLGGQPFAGRSLDQGVASADTADASPAEWPAGGRAAPAAAPADARVGQ